MSTRLLSLGKQANFPFPLCKQCDYMIQQQLASDMATKGYVTVLKAGSISLSLAIQALITDTWRAKQ